MGIKMNDNSNLFNIIQKQVEAAEKAGQPIKTFVKQQIELLRNSHDEFIKTVQEQGYDLKNPRVGDIEIQQYTAMKQLAKKIGLPVDEYDMLIKTVRIRIFGEENYKRFFEQK
jgi:hypothetical protein